MRLTNMPKKKMHKPEKEQIKKDDKVTRYLHASGILMVVSSVFMVTLPLLYSQIYNYMAENAGLPTIDWLINVSVFSGIIIALLYCLLGIFVFRAGEHNTRLARGMSVFNSIMAVLSVIATVMIFMPIPDATFEYAKSFFVSGNPAAGVFPMFVVMLVDAALLVGLVCSVAILDDMCLVRTKKK